MRVFMPLTVFDKAWGVVKDERGIDMNKLAYYARSAKCPKELRLACAFVNPSGCPHGDSEIDPEEYRGLVQLAIGLEMMNEGF